jgi:hypothetical protein
MIADIQTLQWGKGPRLSGNHVGANVGWPKREVVVVSVTCHKGKDLCIFRNDAFRVEQGMLNCGDIVSDRMYKPYFAEFSSSAILSRERFLSAIVHIGLAWSMQSNVD